MKEKLKKTSEYLITFLIPLNWLLGSAVGLAESNAYLKSNYFLVYSIRLAAVLIMVRMTAETQSKDIRGWYCFVSIIVAFATAVIAFGVFLNIGVT